MQELFVLRVGDLRSRESEIIDPDAVNGALAVLPTSEPIRNQEPGIRTSAGIRVAGEISV